MTSIEEQLRAEVADLREKLAGLVGSTDLRTDLRHAFGLSPKQADVLAVLLNAKRPVSTENLYANVFEYDNGDGPNLAIVKVSMSQLRRKLERSGAPHGISSAYGTGCYAATAPLRAWVSERVAA